MNEPKAVSIKKDGSASIAVGVGAVVLTDAIRLGGVNNFALEYKVSCTGTPNIKIEVMQCSDGVNFYVPDNMADVVTALADKDYHGAMIAPICVPWIRFRITEVTGIVTDSVMTINLSLQSKFPA